MKSRTKLEKLVTELSGKLPAITKEQEDWAKEHLFDHFAYKCKDELWCSECGKMWINTSKDKLGDKIECPYCHHQLDVKVSRKQKIRACFAFPSPVKTDCPENWRDIKQKPKKYTCIAGIPSENIASLPLKRRMNPPGSRSVIPHITVV